MDRAPLPGDGLMVVYDLEYTAWPGSHAASWSRPGEHREIIEIGAVLCTAAFEEVGAFECLVRPTVNPALSAYITGLTGITDADLAAHGLGFAEAMGRFWAFAGDAVAALSYGGDDRVIAENYALNRLEPPAACARLRNARDPIQAASGCAPDASSHHLPAALGLEQPQKAHRALGDARSVCAALRHLRGRGLL